MTLTEGLIRTTNSTAVGTVVSYSCGIGYVFGVDISLQTLECGEDGVWSSELLSCQSELSNSTYDERLFK